MVFAPFIHVHLPAVYIQRSLSGPTLPTESTPFPPNTQAVPDLSIHATDSSRAPGTLVVELVPRVPYEGSCPTELAPFFHVQSGTHDAEVHKRWLPQLVPSATLDHELVLLAGWQLWQLLPGFVAPEAYTVVPMKHPVVQLPVPQN
jgi:hypothetical protein